MPGSSGWSFVVPPAGESRPQYQPTSRRPRPATPLASSPLGHVSSFPVQMPLSRTLCVSRTGTESFTRRNIRRMSSAPLPMESADDLIETTPDRPVEHRGVVRRSTHQGQPSNSSEKEKDGHQALELAVLALVRPLLAESVKLIEYEHPGFASQKSNTADTFAAVSPSKDETTAGMYRTRASGTPSSPASASAVDVLPVPGGPTGTTGSATASNRAQPGPRPHGARARHRQASIGLRAGASANRAFAPD